MTGTPLLGTLLLKRGVIEPGDLDAALAEQHRTRELLGAILVRQGRVNDAHVLAALGEQLGIPSVRLEDLSIQPDALAKVPAMLASRYRVIPVRCEDHTVQLAVSDPLDLQMLDELELLVGCEVTPVLAAPQEIQEAIERYYGLGAGLVQHMLDVGGRVEPPIPSTVEQVGVLNDETSVAAFVNQLVLQAVKDRATDLHLEPYEGTVRIRERVDGVLYELPTSRELLKLYPAVVSRIKVMARLDIAERRLPQDGRIKVRLALPPELLQGMEAKTSEPTTERRELDLRVSVLPTSFGEGVDIRILTPGMLHSLEHLGLTHDHRQLLFDLLERPHGILFVTGPTGSGKTTTLYACLSKLNRTPCKILTIEDPIEYRLHGITQLQVHPKIGLSFAQGLRSMLRHDPDIMMVGEVRDSETAEITIRSALTGHLVFSTLHTNDAAGGVARLLDMGIEPYLVASSVLCFIAQRLVRVICPSCQEPCPMNPELRRQFGVAEPPRVLTRGRGCPGCNGTGYKGRTAIYEFLVVDEPLQALIMRRTSSHEFVRAARHRGMRTLREDGWQKVVQGITTPEEVLRVT